MPDINIGDVVVITDNTHPTLYLQVGLVVDSVVHYNRVYDSAIDEVRTIAEASIDTLVIEVNNVTDIGAGPERVNVANKFLRKISQ